MAGLLNARSLELSRFTKHKVKPRAILTLFFSIRLDIYITIIFYAHFLTLFEEKKPHKPE